MPAIRERVFICPNQNGQPAWIVEFPFWWKRGAFFEKFASRQIDTGNPFNLTYGLLLTQGEAIEWDRECREEFARDPRSQQAFAIQAMRQWEAMLNIASWVIVESYEWESGLE